MEGNNSNLEIRTMSGDDETLVEYNRTAGPQLTPYSMVHLWATSLVLGTMILVTIIGNVFVIAAIVLEKNLHNVANYLMLSLAVADLMVAGLVMPLAAVNEVSTQWFLGPEICDMWISFDVLCCTSSILHLVCIALDRYWAVTRVDYIANRSGVRMVLMLVLCWVISVCISIPPLFGWKDTVNNSTEPDHACLISQNWGYTVYSTVGAFYLPLILIMIIYVKIFSAAKSRIRKRNFRTYQAPEVKLPTISETNSHEASTLLVSNGSSTNDANKNNKLLSQDSTNLTPPPSPQVTHKTGLLDITRIYFKEKGISPRKKEKKEKEKLEAKRERKAARTLAIITGTFIGCWLPFFIVATVRPFCGEQFEIPQILMGIICWLGYCNSLLNPVIYTIFNPDFRMAFQKILFGKYRGRRR